MSKKIVLLCLLVLGILVGASYFLQDRSEMIRRFWSGEDSWLCVDGEWIKHGQPSSLPPATGCGEIEYTDEELAKMDLIRLTKPRPNQEIESPLVIEGEARGYWFFEATFPIVLVNWDGLIIAQGYATTQNDWMTEDFVEFKAELSFEKPELYNRGALILQKDNPSGLPEYDDALEIPIIFKRDAAFEEKEPQKQTPENPQSSIPKTEPSNYLLDIPFTSQAPMAEWDNSIFQDGCEEAASLMAIYWIEGKELNPDLARQEIMALADYQEQNFGSSVDTSAQDTLERIIKGYFGYQKAEVKEIEQMDDIIQEIKNGQAVIVPTNGQLLNNPYYTAPGPERHNLVIRGYDEIKGEFITNDPGTKQGELYRYPEQVLFNAIRDYPTGDHQPIEKIEKRMIVVYN